MLVDISNLVWKIIIIILIIYIALDLIALIPSVVIDIKKKKFYWSKRVIVSFVIFFIIFWIITGLLGYIGWSLLRSINETFILILAIVIALDLLALIPAILIDIKRGKLQWAKRVIASFVCISVIFFIIVFIAGLTAPPMTEFTFQPVPLTPTK